MASDLEALLAGWGARLIRFITEQVGKKLAVPEIPRRVMVFIRDTMCFVPTVCSLSTERIACNPVAASR